MTIELDEIIPKKKLFTGRKSETSEPDSEDIVMDPEPQQRRKRSQRLINKRHHTRLPKQNNRFGDGDVSVDDIKHDDDDEQEEE